jgi:hypothetical protein
MSALHTSALPLLTAQCRGVRPLKEQEISLNQEREKHHGHNTTENQQCIFINNAVVGAILVVSRVDGGVARQQQLDDVNATIKGGEM